jgi:DNA gyrase inhibitor GyrI
MKYNLLFDAYCLWSFHDKNDLLMEIVLYILRKLEQNSYYQISKFMIICMYHNIQLRLDTTSYRVFGILVYEWTLV